MQSNWKKTTITFILGNDAAHPVRVVLANGIANPTPEAIEAFGGYLTSLTGLPFRHATVTTLNDVATAA